MILNGAKAITTMSYHIAVVWLATSLAADAASGDTFSTRNPLSRHPAAISRSDNRIQCTGLTAAISFCGLDSDVYHDNYMHAAPLPHESNSGIQSDSSWPRADLLAIFQLALEEFNILSGIRLYWSHTEAYIDELATRFKLKGEIFISDPLAHHQGREKTFRPKPPFSSAPPGPTGPLALITPQTIKWNMGMNPDDLSFYFDLHLNGHLSFSGEFGDESQVGLYFQFAF